MKQYWIAVLLSLAGTLAQAQTPAPAAPVQPVQPGCYHANATFERATGYCKARRVGNTLYVAGQPASGPMPEAVKRIYTNLQQTLAAHGLTFADVVKETVYAVDLDAFIKANDVRKPFYGDVYPAATWVEVRRLFTPALVAEVELEAVFPPGK